MTPLKISIVTPSYNQAEFLERALLSVLEQNYSHLEYIVIDGGSSDGSVDLIRRYADRLTYWESSRDRGQVHALNKGFARATGDVFGWLNSDDILLPNTLERVTEYFRNDEVDIVYGQRQIIDADDRKIQEVNIPDCNPLRFMVYALAALNQEATFWRANLHRAVGELNEAYDQGFDYEYFIRLFDRAQGRWKRAPEFFGAARFHDAQKAVNYDSQGRRVAYVASLQIRNAYLRAHHISRPAFFARSLYYTTLRRLMMPRLPWPRTGPDISPWRRLSELWR